MKTKTGTRPLLCRLNVHHVWKRRRNEEGGSYRQCARCGKDDHRQNGPMDGLWIGGV